MVSIIGISNFTFSRINVFKIFKTSVQSPDFVLLEENSLFGIQLLIHVCIFTL